MSKIYSKEHHQAFIKTSRRVVRQRILAPTNIENYKTMLEATDFSIFKSELIHDFAESLEQNIVSSALTHAAHWKQYMSQPQKLHRPI